MQPRRFTARRPARHQRKYRTLLGLCSHEYFHTWNIKRIKPAVFAAPDLAVENYTRQLWAFEGITSYYQSLALLRCGSITPEEFLELLAQMATRVWRAAGRFKQTLEESSFDAWIKLYKQDDNSPMPSSVITPRARWWPWPSTC